MHVPMIEINLHNITRYQKQRLHFHLTASVCKRYSCGQSKSKKRKFQASILTKKGFHSLTFLLDQEPCLIKVAKLPVGFTNDEFHKMYHTFMSLDGILFFGPQKRLSHNII